jgi:hypothetical protein
MGRRYAETPANSLLRLPDQVHVRALVSGEAPSEAARVLDFRKADWHSKDRQPYRSPYQMTYTQKLVRIVNVVIDKLNDDQLDSLLVAVERIAGGGSVRVPTSDFKLCLSRGSDTNDTPE